MINFLIKWMKEYFRFQNESAKMGIWNIYTMHGTFTHVDHDTYKRYLKEKEKENESS